MRETRKRKAFLVASVVLLVLGIGALACDEGGSGGAEKVEKPTEAPLVTATPVTGPTATPQSTPPSTPMTYVVQPGDTLAGIASHHNTTAEAICAFNELKDCSLVYPGQELLIPSEAIPPETPLPSTPTPTLEPIDLPGVTRFAPAPFGQPVVNDQEIECTVLDVKRGPIGGYADNPHEGREWVVVTIRLRNLCTYCETEVWSPWDFRISGSTGVIYDNHWITDFTLPGGEFFKGAEVTGKLLMEVGTGETGVMLIWDPGAFVSARYLSLEE